MRKAADALSAAGHKVHVLYAFQTNWASESDKELFKHAKWTHEQLGGNPIDDKIEYFISRGFRKIYELLNVQNRAFCRSYTMYLKRGLVWNPDAVIGHNPGTLGLLQKFKKKLNVPTFFDAEDFHRGETPLNSFHSARITALENEVIPNLTAVTAASPLIAQEYTQLYPSVPIRTIDNVFPLRLQPNRPKRQQNTDCVLRMVWFSQVVGLDRGLKEFLSGMALVPDVPIHLSILGSCDDSVREELLAELTTSNHKLTFSSPHNEDKLFAFVASHEIGLALELAQTRNREICRTNKLFTYAMCGCYTLLSRTKAQIEFLSSYPHIGQLIDLSDPATIANAINFSFENRDDIFEKRIASWELARNQLNWDKESEKLVGWVEGRLNAIN